VTYRDSASNFHPSTGKRRREFWREGRRTPQFEAAYQKGRTARREGKPINANAYGDWRTRRGGITWARAFWRVWQKGWVDEDEGRADE